jgi:hypothetical protein
MDLEACLIECLEFVQKFDNTSLFAITLYKMAANVQSQERITTTFNTDEQRRQKSISQSRHKKVTSSVSVY